MDDSTNDAVLASNSAPPSQTLSEEDLRLLQEADNEFIGSFNHSVDVKGRMVVPQSFRQMLGEKFYIAPSYDFCAIGLYTKLAWARTKQRYVRPDPADTEVQEWRAFFTAYSFRDQECDGQGRILLPASIREAILGDEKDLIVSGAGEYVRIVGAKANAERFAAFKERIPDLMNTMSRLRARSQQP